MMADSMTKLLEALAERNTMREQIADLQAENERLKEELKTIKRVVDDTGLINTWPSHEGSILAGRVLQIAGRVAELKDAVEHHFGFDKAPDLIDDYRAYMKRIEDSEA